MATSCITELSRLCSIVYCADRQERIQQVLDRAYCVLQGMDNSVLKCELLLACYREVEMKELLDEAKEVIMSWGGRELTEGEMGMMERWNEIANE